MTPCNQCKLSFSSLALEAFCDIAPCGIAEVHRRFRRAYCIHHQGDGGGIPHVYEPTWRYIPERCHVLATVTNIT
jgi:hypothetical protein